MEPRQIEKALNGILRSLHAKSASINSTSVSDALLSYAQEHDLAPAQLQKLAQAYNHARALAQAKHAGADQRGDDLDVIDSEELVNRYITPPVKKAAEVVAKPEWHAFTCGRKFGGSPSVNLKEVDDWFEQNKDKIGGFQKEADDAAPSPAVMEVEARELEKLANDAASKAGQELNAVLVKVRANRKIAAVVVNDIDTLLGPDGPMVSLPFEHMLKRANIHPGVIDRVPADFCEDEHGIEQHVKAAADHILFAVTARAMSEELKQAAKKKPIVWEAAPDDPDAASILTDGEKEKTRSPEPGEDKIVDQKEDTGVGAAGTYHQRAQQPDNKQPDGKPPKFKYRPPTPADPTDVISAPKPGAPGAPIDLNVLASLGDATGDLLAIPGQLASSTGDALRKADPAGAAASVTSAYATLFGHGREQAAQKLTSKLDLIRQRTTLQRLMLSDPIIRKQDPATVVKVFNTIKSINPTAAADINVAGVLLREALQHQGVPLNVMKTLKEVR